MESTHRDAVFGHWLQRRRRSLDMTQKQLARRAGCSVATVRKLERDERRPSRGLARALAVALGVPEDEHQAFIHFARAGWADEPPAGPAVPLERPWQDGRSPDAAVADPRHSTTLRQLPAPAIPDRPPAGRWHGNGAPLLLARDTELERLDGELGQMLAGNGRVALVVGEAGQGKTALMRAFAARAQDAHPELLVTVGTCNAYTGRGDPFLPFRQVLAQLTGDVPVGPHLDAFERERGARLTRGVPSAAEAVLQHGPQLLGVLLPAQPFSARLRHLKVAHRPVASAQARPQTPSQGTSQHDQLALRADTVAVLTAIANRSPLLLLLDDLHWLDDSSAELLLHLARTVPGHRLMVLGGHRPAEPAHTQPPSGGPSPLDELAYGLATVLDLDRADGRAFVDAWLDREASGLDESFRAALWRLTAGHPLFTIELLRAMQERGEIVEDEGGRWRPAHDLRWDRLPARIADALAARIERLDGPTRDILRVASVEGGTFTAEVAAGVLERDPRDVVSALSSDLYRRHHLAIPVDVSRGRQGLVSRYRFHHDLIQRYVYEAVDPSERAYLHQSVAQALETLLGKDADPVSLAFHYSQAHALDRAAVHHREAGDRARRTHATDRAVEHYQAALEHWPEPHGLDRATLQRDLGECQYLLLRREEATRNLVEAGAAFEDAGDLASAGAVQRALAVIFTTSDDYARAFDASRRAVSMLEPYGPSRALAAALSTRSRLHMLVSEFDEALAWGERAMAMANDLGADDVGVQARIRVGSVLHQLDPPRREEGIALLESSIALADQQGLAYDACHAAYNLADALTAVGRYAEARARLVSCVEYAERYQIVNFVAYSQYALWLHLWRHGEWRDAFVRLPVVRNLVDGTGAADFQMSRFAIGVASSELDLGRFQQAQATLERHGPFLRGLARRGERVPGLGVQLRAASSLGDQRAADRYASEIAAAVGSTSSLEYDIIAPALEAAHHLALSSAASAGDDVAACLAALTQLERQYASPEAVAANREGRAWKAVADGIAAQAADLFVAAADSWRAGTFPLQEARARAAASRSARTAGRAGEAGTQIERARALLSGLSEEIADPDLRGSFAQLAGAVLSARGGAAG